MLKGLASDNYAGVLPEIMDALVEANKFHEKSYGNDTYTSLAKEMFKKHFGEQIESTFVFNGTGANVLGIANVTRSFNSILCADTSHLFVDESTAPETLTGCRLVPIKTNGDGKMELESIQNAIIRQGDEHHPQVRVFSLAQSTEYGTVYSIEELKSIGKLLKEHHIIFHMDGARIYNAMVHLNVSFKELITDTGIDILSLGGTKIGILYGEAIIFLDKKWAVNLKYIQKQSMQLPSKMRFISAQFLCLFERELWKKSATHSNSMALYLRNQLKSFPQIEVTKPVQSNAVFAIIPKEWNEILQSKLLFYVWNEKNNEVRWMCSFDTTTSEIDSFIVTIKSLVNS